MNQTAEDHSKTYHRILRQKYAQDDQWISDFLVHAQVGHVASHWENQPFITPLLFWFDAEKKALYFHTNIKGRLLENSKHFPEVCFEASEMGKLLPSNAAMEFGMQYASVVVFGKLFKVENDDEKRHALQELLNKYFPDLTAGVDYRPITQEELDCTAVIRIDIESWSGKKNWKEQVKQIKEWKLLDEAVIKKYLG